MIYLFTYAMTFCSRICIEWPDGVVAQAYQELVFYNTNVSLALRHYEMNE